MLSIRREALVMSGSGIREPLAPAEEVVEACRSGDSIVCVPHGVWTLRVLIVDDDPDCADSLSTLVRLWGHDVQTAYNGAAALAMMSNRQPDVALLDLAMPKMDGYQMARRLRRQMRFNHTLLIALTGYADQAHRLLCDEAGFDHFVIKPIELADLQNLLLGEQNRLIPFSRRE